MNVVRVTRNAGECNVLMKRLARVTTVAEESQTVLLTPSASHQGATDSQIHLLPPSKSHQICKRVQYTDESPYTRSKRRVVRLLSLCARERAATHRGICVKRVFLSELALY